MTGPAAFSDGELIRFAMVGERAYVRGVDIVRLVEERCPRFQSVEIRFVTPLAGAARVEMGARKRAAVAIALETETGAGLRFGLVAEKTGPAARSAEPPQPAHLAWRMGKSRWDCLAFGRLSHAELLDVMFHLYQARAGRRFLLKRLRLHASRASGVNWLSLRVRGGAAGQSCELRRNGRTWCEIEMTGRNDRRSGRFEKTENDEGLVQGHQ